LKRADALLCIPRTYELAVRLRDEGVPDALIAECVAVELEALGLHYAVAEAKLTDALNRDCHDADAAVAIWGEVSDGCESPSPCRQRRGASP
jgi:hypothetical protein